MERMRLESQVHRLEHELTSARKPPVATTPAHTPTYDYYVLPTNLTTTRSTVANSSHDGSGITAGMTSAVSSSNVMSTATTLSSSSGGKWSILQSPSHSHDKKKPKSRDYLDAIDEDSTTSNNNNDPPHSDDSVMSFWGPSAVYNKSAGKKTMMEKTPATKNAASASSAKKKGNRK